MKLLPSFLFVLCVCALRAQHGEPPLVFCGNEIFSDIIQTHYSELGKAFTSTFEEAKNFSPRSTEPLNVRVVVHVVWNAPEENLHDSIILNQIQVLNEDYNRLNPDTADLRSIFQNDAGNANIHFELEEIVRVNTDQLFVVDLLGTNLLAEVKHNAEGGSDAWDPESYLNIWITKIQPIEIFGIVVGQILGFAFPPNGLDHWPKGVSAPTPGEDGVVLDYRIIGRNNPHTIENPDGTGNLLTVRGRSATHEVGHYLGLRHIWGDGGLLGPNDCLQSDGIDDTPFADAQSAFDCDKEKNSCDQVEPHYNENMPDLVENYMDYSSEACMNMFTQGQVNLMRNVLHGPRAGLLEEVSSTQVIEEVSFNVYPNPADDFIKVRWTKDQGQGLKTTVRILDVNGRILFTDENAETHDLTIDVTNFDGGIYFVEVSSEKAFGAVKVFLK